MSEFAGLSLKAGLNGLTKWWTGIRLLPAQSEAGLGVNSGGPGGKQAVDSGLP